MRVSESCPFLPSSAYVPLLIVSHYSTPFRYQRPVVCRGLLIFVPAAKPVA